MKYAVVLAAFALLMIFARPYNYRARWQYARQIQQLEKEIRQFKQKSKENNARREQLGNNPEDLERFAREHYHMKAEDEDLYIVYEGDK
ncbi:MAG: septum formation initiator family protein [Paludibacteraceae bacterium]|nr:septum formation initiator family protein [Paludibacteraceae bacterium]